VSHTPASELLGIADTAVDLVTHRLDRSGRQPALAIDTKSSRTDMVTDIDRWVEAQLVQSILGSRPHDGILGEEGSSRPSESGVTWVIDPIDGTTNFIYDIPGYSISVAASVEGRTVAGLVHDPVRDERFRATRGGGATRNGATISVSSADDLSTALVATGFSYDSDRRRAQAGSLVTILPAVRDIRRMGGAALDLCALACGRVDAYFERGLAPWDTAAGALIASEAGAVLDHDSVADGAFFGSAPAIFDQFSKLLEEAGAHSA